MSTFSIGITWNAGTPPVGTFNQMAQAAGKLDQSLQASAQNFDRFGMSIGDIDKPLGSVGQAMGDLGDSMDGLDKSLDSSAGAMEDLGGATEDMSDAVKGVGDSVGDAAQGFEELNDGAENAQNSLGEVSDSIDSASQGLGEMSTGLEETGTGFEDMNTSLEASNTGLTDMTSTVEETTTGLSDMTTGVEDTVTGVEELGTGIEDAGTGFEDFGSSLSDATNGMEGFEEGIGDVGSGVSILSGSFDDATGSTSEFSGALGNVGTEIEPVNGGLTQSNLLTQNLSGSTKALGGNFSGLGISMAGVSGAAVGLFNAYDNIGDAAVAVEAAQGALIRTEARAETSINNLDKAMEDLNKKYSGQIEGLNPLNEAYAKWKSLVDQNITSGAEYDQALQNLRTAQENANGTTRDAEQALTAVGGKIGMTEAALIKLVVAENNDANSREALNQTYLETATSIIPAVILGLSGLKGSHESLSKMWKAAPGAMSGFVGVLKTLPGIFSGIGTAITTTMLPALGAIAVPVGIAVLAFGAFVSAMAALRATLPFWDDLGASIGNAIPQSVDYLNALRDAFIATSDATNSSVSFILGGLDQLTGGGLKLKEGFDKWTATLPDAQKKALDLQGGIQLLDTGMSGLNTTIVMQKGTFDDYNGNLKDLNGNMIALKGGWFENAEGAAVVTKAYNENSDAAASTSETQNELNSILKPYVPLILDAASGADAQGQAAQSASQANQALDAALKGNSGALAEFIQGATGGAISSTDLGIGAETATEGIEGITPAAEGAAGATMTFDEILNQLAQSTDPVVAGLAQAIKQLKDEGREAETTLEKNRDLLQMWGIKIPDAIKNDVNAIQALVNIHKDEKSAMDQTIIKADEVILQYGDIAKAASMTREEKIRYAKQLEETVKKTEEEAAAMEDSIPIHEQIATKVQELTQKRKDEIVETDAARQELEKYLVEQKGMVGVVGESIQVLEALDKGIKAVSTAYEDGRASIVTWVTELMAAEEKEQGALDKLQPLVDALKMDFPEATRMSSEELMRLTEQVLKSGQGWEDYKEKVKTMVDDLLTASGAFNDFVSSIDFREIDDDFEDLVDEIRDGTEEMIEIAEEDGVEVSDAFKNALDFEATKQAAAGQLQELWPALAKAVDIGMSNTDPNLMREGIDIWIANAKHALEDGDLPGATQQVIGGILTEIDNLKNIKDPVKLMDTMSNIKSKIDGLATGKENLESTTTALTSLTQVSPENLVTIAQKISEMATAADTLQLSPQQIDAWAQSLSQLTGVPVDELKAELIQKMQETGDSATSKLMEAGPGGDAARIALGQQMVLLANVFLGFQTDVGEVFVNIIKLWDAFVISTRGEIAAMGTELGKLTTAFGSMAANVGVHLGKITTAMTSTVNNIATQAGTVGAHLGKITTAFGSMVTNTGKHLNSFTSSFKGAMSSIVTDANRAIAGVNALQRAIDSLQSKTITLTTIHRTLYTTGYAAKGGAFVASNPMNVGPLKVSEFGQKELVTVTPLQGPGRTPIKGVGAAINDEITKKGRRRMDETEERRLEAGRSAAKPTILQDTINVIVDAKVLTSIVNRRLLENTDALV